MSLAKKRLIHDYKKLSEEGSVSGINGQPISEDLLKWEAVIFGYLINLVRKTLTGMEEYLN